jgi:predicted nucleic acid-binding protein
VILDASVAVKWFLLDEDLRLEAAAIRDALLDERIRLAAPANFWTELANAVVRALRRDRIDQARALALADHIQTVQPLLDGVAVDPHAILETALSVGISAHDAIYLAAADQIGSSVITADAWLHERGRAHGYDVVWLGDVTLRDGVLVNTPQGYS